jgi:hypothetical protein
VLAAFAALIGGAAAFAAVAHGTAQGVWLGVLGALCVPPLGILYFELAPHRVASDLARWLRRRRRRAAERKAERDWRADVTHWFGRWQLCLWPPGSTRLGDLVARSETEEFVGVTATVSVVNDAGRFTGTVPYDRDLGFISTTFESLGSPIAGDHHVSWASDAFEGERVVRVRLDERGEWVDGPRVGRD